MAKRKGIMATVARRPSHRPSKLPGKKGKLLPGPTANPVTSLLLADIAVRAGSYLARRGIEKGLLPNRDGKPTARQIAKNRTLGQTVMSWALARVATRSVPGAIVVGGAALAKTLIDRRTSRRKRASEDDAGLADQAADE